MREKIDEWNKCHQMEFFSKSIIYISHTLIILLMIMKTIFFFGVID